MHQLELIYRLCGSPTPESWPDFDKVPLYKVHLKLVVFFKKIKLN